MHHPKHIPFKGGRGGIEIGLKPINEDNWLEIDHLFEAELKLKKALLQDKKDVVLVSNNDYLDTERELLELIIDFLKIYHPESYHFGENSVTIKKSDQYLHFDDFESPIELASLLIQEDLVIMHPQDESFYLEAACVCAPTRWSLIDKFQKSLTEIHKEVPGYQERLDGRVKTIFKNLPNNRIFERLNWGIVDDPALFQPVNSKTLVEIENTDPVNLFLRSERQTIRKLTKNRSVIFTIRVHVDSIFSILKNIEHRKDLVEAIQNLEEPMKEYKVIKPFEKKLLNWLKIDHD